ncbi:MAG TPA: hypothetical protein VMW03_05110 [Candidatus Krumholzibacteriaceae bacterium]|nr:hypothetical protein [Candidatus Krumholzibacteriaceae bacterium]
MFTARPYSHRAIIKDMTPEQVYKTVRSWLAMNGCSFQQATPPNYIEAVYRANHPVTQVGLRDDYPKDIAIRMTAFGRDTVLQITVTQREPRFKDKGYLYWGSRIEGLLWELETPPTREQVLSLYPEEMVNKEIRTKFRFYAVVTAALILMLVAFPVQIDVTVLVVFVIIAPVVLIGVLDTIDYWRLLSRTAAPDRPWT